MHTYPGVRSTSLAALAISLAAHVGVVAAVRMRPPSPLPPVDPSPQLTGETFELPAPESRDSPLGNASPPPETAAAPPPVDEFVGSSHPFPNAHARPSSAASHQSTSASKASSGEPGGGPGQTGTALYGAVGDRSATDLAKTFTRAFRQVASADPAWTTAPLGPAGSATVVLSLDPDGHIDGISVTGAPGAALTSSIQRTMALIKGRPFVSKGKTTKLVLDAKITTDTVHDGRFALGSDFVAEEGTAFFALPIGRRIDLRVRLGRDRLH